MATIRKRGKSSYQLVAYSRYDESGKQKREYRTWKVPAGMTPTAAKKAAQKAADEFEDSLRGGTYKGRIKFALFLEKWFEEYAQPVLKAKTVDGYRGLIPVLLDRFGTLYLDEIDAEQLAAFYSKLGKTKKQSLYRTKKNFLPLLQENNLNPNQLKTIAEVSESVAVSAVRGKTMRLQSAEKIAAALHVSLKLIFEEVKSDEYLNPNTVLHYHRFLSSVLQTAVSWKYLKENPARLVTKPRKPKKEIRYLQPDDVFKLIQRMEEQSVPPKYRLAILTLILTGLRREELMGLKWKDIDFKNCTMEVLRAVVYIRGQGLQISDTKTEGSYRVIALPQCLLEELTAFYQKKNASLKELGHCIQQENYVFQEADGHLLWPSSLASWVNKFYKRNPDLKKVSPHGFRHTNASIQINNGVPLTAVAESLGHANTQTTASVYAHVIEAAKVAAARQVDSILAPYLKKAE